MSIPLSRTAALAIIAVVTVLASGCGQSSATGVRAVASSAAPAETALASVEPTQVKPAEPTPTAPPTSSSTAAATPPKPPDATRTKSALAESIVELPKAVAGFPAQVEQSAPTRLRIPSLGIDAAIIAVGVDANGEYDVPPADQVGWYRYGTTPGQPGSAVLAAHIAYNGQDGVFRNLDDVEPGAVVTIDFADGSTIDLGISAQAQYDKDQLPDDLFARTGDPRVVLITCGGDFNRSISSYEDNIVAFATPATL